MTESTCCPDAPCERLLEAAERLFAEKGFHAVSVREITQAAGTNLAAVNYHFGGKKKLYLEVFQRRWIPRARRLWGPLLALEQQEEVTTEQVVCTLARVMLEHPFDEEAHQRHFQLMLRERLHPTEARTIVLDGFMRPTQELLSRLLTRSLPSAPDPREMGWDIQMIIGMAIHLHHSIELRARQEGTRLNPEEDRRLMDHMVHFALRGLGLDPEEARG